MLTVDLWQVKKTFRNKNWPKSISVEVKGHY